MNGKVDSIRKGDAFNFSGKDFQGWDMVVDGKAYAYNALASTTPPNVGDNITFEIGDKNKAGIEKIKQVRVSEGAISGSSSPGPVGPSAVSNEGQLRVAALDKALMYFEVAKLKPAGVDGVIEVAQQFANFLQTGTNGETQSND